MTVDTTRFSGVEFQFQPTNPRRWILSQFLLPARGT